MIGAFHKETKKYVTSYMILKDIEWIGREKEKFYSPTHEIINWEELGDEKEIPVIFVKESIDGKRPHWRIHHDKAKSSSINESPEHKEIKETIYYDLVLNNSKLKIGNNLYSIDELSVKNISIEGRICEKKDSKIADVLIEFKEYNPMIGNGIAIEIQLSRQTELFGLKRSYDRSVYGYSCAWIDKKIFYEDYLIKKVIEVDPYFECIEKYKEEVKDTNIELVNNIGFSINEKIKEMFQIKNQIDLQIKLLKNTKEELSNELINLFDKVKGEFKDEYFEELKNSILPEINNQKEKILKESKEQVNKIINEKLDSEKIKEELIISGNSMVEDLSIELINNLKQDIEYEFKNTYKEKIDELVKEIKKDENFQNIEELRKKLEKQLFESWRSNHLKFESYSNMVNDFFTEDLDKCAYWNKTLNDAITNPKHILRENYKLEDLKIMRTKAEILLNDKKIISKSRKEDFKKENGETQTNIC